MDPFRSSAERELRLFESVHGFLNSRSTFHSGEFRLCATVIAPCAAVFARKFSICGVSFHYQSVLDLGGLLSPNAVSQPLPPFKPSNTHPRCVRRASGLVVCWACSAAWR